MMLCMIKLLRALWPPLDEAPVEDEEETPRYPPFMRGLPAKSVDKLLDSQAELIGRLRGAVGITDELYDEIYTPLIRRYAAYVHLLPASEAHHHRGAGGLLRHGLEVALWATQGADRIMFATGEPPARRRELEPRWKLGVFIAALLHDIGKPMSDVQVVDETGEHEWGAHGEDLADWLARVNSKRYYLHWRDNRHQRHESLTPLVLPHVIPKATMGYLQTAGPELYKQILFAISSRDFQARDQEHNPIFKLVREADQHSTRKDIGDPLAAGMPGALGVPLERYLMDAMRRLTRERTWACNKPGSRLWVMDNSVFVVWPSGAEDIVKMLARDQAPGIPRHPDSLADVLLDRGLAIPFEEAGSRARLWTIQPEPLRERNPGVVLHAIRLDSNASVFDEFPASVPGEIGVALLEKLASRERPSSGTEVVPKAPTETNPEPEPGAASETVAEPARQPNAPNPAPSATPAAPSVSSPERGATNEPARSRPDVAPTTEPDAAAKSTAGVDTRSRATREAAPVEAEEARAWFSRQGHAGAVIASLAEDFRDGVKNWAEHGVRMKDGGVAIRHPEGWAGAGVEAKEILSMLSEAGWVSLDPFQPMKRVREVDGFTALKGASQRSTIVLTEAVSQRFAAISGEVGASPQTPKAKTGTPAKDKPKRQKPSVGPEAAPDQSHSSKSTKRKGKAKPESEGSPQRTHHADAGSKSDSEPKGPQGKKDASKAKAAHEARPDPNPESPADHKSNHYASKSDNGKTDRDALIATLHALIAPDGAGLTHRLTEGQVYIPRADAVAAVADRIGISLGKAQQAMNSLPTSPDGNEIVLPGMPE